MDYQEVSGGVCGAVIDHVFNHEVSEEEFNMVDANGDGVLEPEELLAFAEENAHHLGRSSQRMFGAGMYSRYPKEIMKMERHFSMLVVRFNFGYKNNNR